MANYIGFTRTNYFSVTDADKLRDIVNRIVWGEGELNFLAEENGRWSFGAYGNIRGLRPAEPVLSDEDGEEEDSEWDADEIYAALQEIIAPGDAAIITEIGYENLRYLVGDAVIITRDSIEAVNLQRASLDAARTLLHNPAFNTQMEY